MSKYIIRFHHGWIGDLETDTLEDAKRLADKVSGRTCQDITIERSNGRVILRRTWNDFPLDDGEGCKDPISFGDLGHYGDWEDEPESDEPEEPELEEPEPEERPRKYYVKFHTGAGDCEADTLEEAKRLGDDGACYTQEDISIEDAHRTIIMTRPWIGVAYDGGSEDPIVFGDFGFYADWQEWDNPVLHWFDAHPGGIPGYTI